MTTLSPALQAAADELYEQVAKPTAVKGKSEDVFRQAGIEPLVVENVARRIEQVRPEINLLPAGAVILMGGLIASVAINEKVGLVQ